MYYKQNVIKNAVHSCQMYTIKRNNKWSWSYKQYSKWDNIITVSSQ